MELRFNLPQATGERNWLPLIIAFVLVVAVVTAGLVMGSRKPTAEVRAIIAGADPYATYLPMTNLVMSESTSLSGGKVTDLDGHLAHTGSPPVSAIWVTASFSTSGNEAI